MKWRGLPFQGDMVLATRAGLKTETRRVVKLPHDFTGSESWNWGVYHVDGTDQWEFDVTYQGEVVDDFEEVTLMKCPYGVPGDGLYVREAWAAHFIYNGCPPSEIFHDDGKHCLFYAADGYIFGGCTDSQKGRGRPSIHMPRWASRQGVILTDVAVERVQDITDSGAILEGISGGEWRDANFRNPSLVFGDLWDRINGPRGYGWEANPWVWRLRYELTDELPPALDTK